MKTNTHITIDAIKEAKRSFKIEGRGSYFSWVASLRRWHFTGKLNHVREQPAQRMEVSRVRHAETKATAKALSREEQRTPEGHREQRRAREGHRCLCLPL